MSMLALNIDASGLPFESYGDKDDPRAPPPIKSKAGLGSELIVQCGWTKSDTETPVDMGGGGGCVFWGRGLHSGRLARVKSPAARPAVPAASRPNPGIGAGGRCILPSPGSLDGIQHV